MLAICARKSVHVIVACFEGTTLGGANLSNWDLARACLRGFDLSRTCLRGANLRGADLAGANLCAADLTGADLEGALLSQAVYDADTQWPAGFDPAARGAQLNQAGTTWVAGEGQRQALWRGDRLESQKQRRVAREQCERSQQLRFQVAQLACAREHLHKKSPDEE